MKLIIDIPEEAYKTIMNTSFVWDVDLTFKQSAKDTEQTNAIFSLIDALDNGTPIPDNATVCDIEQIRDEIEESITDYILGEEDTNTAMRMGDVMTKVFEIIDKYREEQTDAT